jgi:anti-sigma-K factor RskA
MEQNGVHELTAAYALDALADDDAREYEGHLRHCDRCRDDLRSLQETAALLAFGAEPATPPPGLRDRIVDAARAERPNVVPLRPRWAYPVAGAAAVAAAAAVALAIWATSLSHSLHGERSLLGERARVVAVQGAPGHLLVAPSGKAALVLSRLPAAPRGRTYEAWVVPQGGMPRPAGLFRGAPGGAVIVLSEHVAAGATVGVTSEVAGGSAVPHGRMLVVGHA